MSTLPYIDMECMRFFNLTLRVCDPMAYVLKIRQMSDFKGNIMKHHNKIVDIEER